MDNRTIDGNNVAKSPDPEESAEVAHALRAQLAAVTGGIAPDVYANAWWDWYLNLAKDTPKQHEMMQDALGAPIYGLMIGQNGMSSTMNARLPSALLGTKVVDAIGDIRAHPTGDMGSIGMAGSPEATSQVAAGGHRNSNSYIELVVRGATAKISPILRKAADMSGGFIASRRNGSAGH